MSVRIISHSENNPIIQISKIKKKQKKNSRKRTTEASDIGCYSLSPYRLPKRHKQISSKESPEYSKSENSLIIHLGIIESLIFGVSYNYFLLLVVQKVYGRSSW